MASDSSSVPGQRLLVLVAAVAALFSSACREAAGPPPALEAGSLSFTFANHLGARTFAVDGSCYESPGYPAADSSCALALPGTDTLRIRAVLEPRTLRWAHVNVDVPPDGTCAPEGCRIAYDLLNLMGKVERSFRSIEATVTVLEATEGRMRGTFSARMVNPNGGPSDTLRISAGAFDVPVAP